MQITGCETDTKRFFIKFLIVMSRDYLNIEGHTLRRFTYLTIRIENLNNALFVLIKRVMRNCKLSLLCNKKYVFEI